MWEWKERRVDLRGPTSKGRNGRREGWEGEGRGRTPSVTPHPIEKILKNSLSFCLLSEAILSAQ